MLWKLTGESSVVNGKTLFAEALGRECLDKLHLVVLYSLPSRFRRRTVGKFSASSKALGERPCQRSSQVIASTDGIARSTEIISLFLEREFWGVALSDSPQLAVSCENRFFGTSAMVWDTSSLPARRKPPDGRYYALS